MAFDWLKSLRTGLQSAPRRQRRSFTRTEPLEMRVLLSAVPVDSEFKVNTWTTDGQRFPSSAMDAAGNFVVTWSSSGQDSSEYGVYAQRYNAAGIPQGDEFLVNTATLGRQWRSDVAMDPDGNFVIAWTAAAQDFSSDGIFAQRYNAAGVPQGGEFQVNTWTSSAQRDPTVAMDGAGNFVIAWTSVNQDGSNGGIYAQRYNAAGVTQGIEFQVNTWTTGAQSLPSIAMDLVGDFVITWPSSGQDGSLDGVYAQRYNASGLPQGTEFRVNTWTTNSQTSPVVAMDADGDFVITWTTDGQSGSGFEVYAQRYNAAGVPQGSEFHVNTFTSGSQLLSTVAMDGAGDFVITWMSGPFEGGTIPGWQDGNGYGVYAQRYTADGNPDGPEFQVNTYTTGNQRPFAIGMAPGGDFVIGWESFGQDGSNYGIYSQRFTTNQPPTDLILSKNTVDENRPVGTPVGMFSTVDPDVGNTFTYTLVSGTGSTDNGSFVIVGNELRTAAVLDFETQSNYSIRVRTTDQGGQWFEKVFSILVMDENENISLPVGTEFQVNTWTTNGQIAAAIAMDSTGDYVITWVSLGQDGSGTGVFAQRFNAAGIPQGSEFRGNSWTTGDQQFASIAMDADGDFVITWQSNNQDGDGYGIYAQRYNASGVPQGPEFRVNSWTKKNQITPSIAMDAAGDFIITWASEQDKPYNGTLTDFGIYAQRYDAFGVPQGSEFQVNSWTLHFQMAPSIAMDDAGDFVITWQSADQDGSNYGIYAQRYDAQGGTLGSEFQVNSWTSRFQEAPSIAMNSSGDFVIAWQSYNQDGSGYGSYAQRYDAQGVPQGPEFQINSWTTGDQFLPSIGMDAAGDFVVTWTSFGQDGSSYGIYAQRYDSQGVPQGTEFQVNSWTTGKQASSLFAMDDIGDFVITWAGIGQDTSSYGVYAQRYRVVNNAPVLNNAGVPTLDPLLQNQSLATNNGTLVSDLIARMGPSGGITDPNGNPLGIAINGVSNTYGSWQYTVNGGTNWTPINVTGNNNALLLAADGNTRIRFLPNANFIGQSIFAFVAWDRTSGANGGTANVSSRGGRTAFSLGYEIATINVNNAAPVLNNAGAPTLNSIPMNVYGVDNTGTLVTDIIARMGPSGGITDANPGALQGIAINGLGNTANGDWQYSINGGATWSLIGTTGNSNARLLAADANTRIRYVPQVGYLGTAVFSFVAWDRTSGGNAAVVSVGTRGGATPYSTDFEYASISILNSAPVLNDAGSPLLDGILPNIPDASNPGTLVSDLIYRMYPAGGITDANPYALRGIAIIAKSGTGTWEFSTNNGTSWSTLNSTSAANATLLSSDSNTRVRYRPAAGFVGEAKIAFVAWDQSSGTNGSVANASTRGGTTAFSTAFEYASIFVNTPPTLNNAGTPTLDSISNTLPASSNSGILVSTLISRMGPAGGITDPDPAALKGLAIIGQSGSSSGTWQFSTNGGTSWSTITSTGSANALLLASDSSTRVRYVPNAGFTGTVAIAFAAWDRSQWLNGSTVNAGARGGATPFSLDYETATITITS